ncbi:hypothetical protein [Methanosarcina sp. UBA411]|uniref:hypothetical protein n=1 Tax=Methanosarcina sp. UBA411 TaxID=1915589 RepID=UPI0025E4C5ED|nr:hypothetical protein [Methanosarcina sp. UBA411]
MGILSKIFGKKEIETKKESKKAIDEANREKTRTSSPAKASIIDKVKSQKEQNAKRAPKGKAERASQKAAEKSAQKAAQKVVKRR